MQIKNTITIDLNTAKFVVNPPAKSDKEYIYGEAVRRAYGDMSRRTLHFEDPHYCGDKKDSVRRREDLKEDWKGRIKGLFLRKENDVLTHVQDYDEKHRILCNEVSGIFTSEDVDGFIPIKETPADCNNKEERKKTFSMGQAQKVVNMVWKYVYLFYQYYFATEGKYEEELKCFQRIIPFLHAPVDSLVIKGAARENVNEPAWPWRQLS